MCHYCCYLTHRKSVVAAAASANDAQCFPHYFKRHRRSSCHVTIPLCLVSLTLFFIMLNITLVLSQSSQSQQQAEQLLTNILEDDSRGKLERETTLLNTHGLAAE